MPEIEFVGADPGDPTDDDLLDTGPRRPVPRWVWLVAAVLAVAVGVGVVVSAHSDRAPTAIGSTPPPSTATTSVPEQSPPVTALTADGTSLYWLAGNRLYRAGPTGRAARSTPVSPQEAEFSEPQLVADPAERAVWVVSFGSADGSSGVGVVEGFATDDLRRVTRASARSRITGAAALNGALYVLAGGRLLRITTGSSGFTPIARVDLTAHGLVAADGNLLFVEGGNGSAIGRWTPSGVDTPAVLETVDNTLAVAGSTVFLLGTNKDRSLELDTLRTPARTVDERALATGLDGPLQLVAAGARSVIVLGLGRRGDELACVTTANQVDAPGPAKVQALAVATSPYTAVLGSQVFQADGDSVRPVTFNVGRCTT